MFKMNRVSRLTVGSLLIGAVTLISGGAAMADPLPLESPTSAPAEVGEMMGPLCNNALIGLWCLIGSASA